MCLRLGSAFEMYPTSILVSLSLAVIFSDCSKKIRLYALNPSGPLCPNSFRPYGNGQSSRDVDYVLHTSLSFDRTNVPHSYLIIFAV